MLQKRQTEILAREIDGEFVLLDTKADRIHQLNSTASFIWRLCDAGLSAEAIAIALAEQFDVTIETVRRDVAAILKQLVELQLVVDVPPEDTLEG